MFEKHLMWGLVCNSPLNSLVVPVEVRAGHTHEGTTFQEIPLV